MTIKELEALPINGGFKIATRDIGGISEQYFVPCAKEDSVCGAGDWARVYDSSGHAWRVCRLKNGTRVREACDGSLDGYWTEFRGYIAE